jgi:hypothetical protein
MVNTRESIYYLTYLASYLQKVNQNSDPPSRKRLEGFTSSGRALNHLSTLLSRGKVSKSPDESIRAVAAVVTSFDLNGLDVCIVSK